MCGDEAAAARSMLQITYPVCDQRDMERRGRQGKSGIANWDPANV
jgi:hypothetical protein